MKKIFIYSEQYKTNRTFIEKKCDECFTGICILESEFNRGGGRFCSRKCYFSNMKKTRPRGEDSWAWKGDKVGIDGLHSWVAKNLGIPRLCEHCGTTKAKQFDWANKSQKYKRDLSDWIRLCRSCHAKYDYNVRHPKWKKAVSKLGWKLKK